ncbi:MAG: hypothetical protein ACJ77E_17700 [Gaiellaceae bacterium]
MGMSVSWAAVQGAEGEAVLRALGLAETGERDELPAESPIAAAALHDGWYVVVFDRYGHELVSDDALRRLSRLGDVVAGAAEEHVMCCFSCGWRAGERVWWLAHDAQEGIDHLQVEGTAPAAFDDIRRELLAEQAAAGRSDADVDYLFDIPLQTAERVSGFSYSETAPAGGFAVLRAVG